MKIKLDAVKETKTYLLADELELYLVFKTDFSELSRSDIYSLIRETESDFFDESETKEYYYESMNDTEFKIDENIQIRIEEVFTHFKNRKEWFNDFYPFYVEDNIFCVPRDIRDKHKTYVSFLICSRLSNFDKSAQHKLAKAFESVCAEALKKWIPSLEVRIFASNSIDRKNYFGNNLRDALKKLAEDCNGKATELIDNKHPNGQFKLKPNGDLGLDVVGYQPFKDQAQGKLIIFGQCAAGKENWKNKTMDAHYYSRFRSYITFACPPINMVFTPACFRDTDKDWYEDRPVMECLLVDRLRLCHMLGSSQLHFPISLEEIEVT